VLMVNRPQGLRNTNEKLSISWFPQCSAPSLVTSDSGRLHAFLQEQRELLMSALASSEISMEEMKELFGVNAWEDRQECLASIMDELAIYAD